MSAPGHAHASAPLVAVIGGGFSGVMVAANLLRLSRQAARPLRIALFERRPEVGKGAAYATQDEAHLLNVPVRGMSAWPDRPEDFLDWLRARRPGTQGGDFVPRVHYAAYLDHTLRRETEAASGVAELAIHHVEVECVERAHDHAWLVRSPGRADLRADIVVIATGHRAPGDPLQGRWSGPRDRWIADPWRPDALGSVKDTDAVALIGSGLTATDLSLSLCRGESPRPGRVHLLSRSGQMPRVHAQNPVQPVDMLPVLNELAFTGGVSRVRSLMRALRVAIRKAGPHGDWRAFIDGLRPYIHGIWSALPLAERRRFFRHARSLWEVHRHRTAPEIGARIATLQHMGALVSLRARPLAAEATSDSVRLRFLERLPDASSRERSIDVQWVVNCSGPSAMVGHHEDRVAASLIDAGHARMDPLGLGFETDMLGRPIGRDGRSAGGLWVLGSLRRPALWETTAVPELRGQAETVARECMTALA